MSKTSVYPEKIKWGIQEIEVRTDEKGFWGKHTPQSNPRADAFERKINPNNENYYLKSPNGEPELFYGKYYWLTAFNTKYKKLFGDDASLDQQLFKLCEDAEQENLDVDWQTVESIEKAASANVN